MRRHYPVFFFLCLGLFLLSNCGTKEASSESADSTGSPDAQETSSISFEFSWAPTSIFSGPFPSDLFLGQDGKIQLDPLGEDARFKELARANALEMLDGHLATRDSFGFTSPIFFPVGGELDMDSLTDKVKILTLEGPEAPREVRAEVFWNAHANVLGVFPAWGDYLMPGSTYAVWIEDGVLSADGVALRVDPGFASMIAAAEEADLEAGASEARALFAPVRTHLKNTAGDKPSPLIGTIFSTQTSMDYLQTILKSLDSFTLTAPTTTIRWNPETEAYESADAVEGEDLEAYFGASAEPFMRQPGKWGTGSREDAALLSEGASAYTGGTFHQGIAKVIHGSVMVPAANFVRGEKRAENIGFSFDDDGLTWSLEAMVPFTIFICESHKDDLSNLPVAIFSHGGTTTRADGLSFAVMNCLEGVATLSYDMPFHGGRSVVSLNDDEDILLPVQTDTTNGFTGLTSEDDGYIRDNIGDHPGAVETVGNMFGIGLMTDPAVVEANLLSFSMDSYIMLRYVMEGDWFQIHPDLSFDTSNIFHQSLSFGTSLTTALLSGTSAFKGAMNGVGSAYIFGANLTVAPSNGLLASSVIQPLLGLKSTPSELNEGAYKDPVIALIQWLSERGDSMAYAPYLLRHRQVEGETHFLSIGNSWDMTLSSTAQYSFNEAVGFPVYKNGKEWTLDPSIPGISEEYGEAYDGTPISQNLSIGDRTYTSGIFFTEMSCHALQVNPLCSRSYELNYPPITTIEEKVVTLSPICSYQNQARHFLGSLINTPDKPEIIAPGGTYDDLYKNNDQ